MSMDVKITQGYRSDFMVTSTATYAHIAYELIDDQNPEVVVIEFLSPEICGSLLAAELGEQLDALIRSELPQNFVIDFAKVRSLGSTAFGEIADFVRRAGRVRFCNLDWTLELGAALIGIGDRVDLLQSRSAAIRAARGTSSRSEEEDTVDFP
jgi:anti-anti-sigma regulatory factor